MAAIDPVAGASRVSIDRRITLGALINAAALMLHLLVLVLGGVWVAALLEAKVDSLNNGLVAFKADVSQQLSQLRADLSADTRRLDGRVDNLRDRPILR
jgi:hypothetical protein